jgi:CheY-like chemotaxis protein
MDPNLGRVLADGGQLQRVLMNLVANARDAMPNGGNLTIGTANVELAAGRPEHMGEIAPGSYVLLTVKDTGTGMAAETQKRIFEPFFTTKENGMGLGLSTAYGIVRQCGGSISVFSEPGHGTVFRIYIPRTDAPALTPDEPEQLQELSGNETILVVEDNGKVRRLTAEFLKLYGYKVLEASQGGEALLAAEQHAGPIHLMLTDVMMPRMTGLELAQRIKPLREETRVLFMSGHADNVITHWGVVDKGVEYIAKPFTPEALAARIRKVLAPPEEAGSVQ